MAIHIHVKEEKAPRLVGFDTHEIAHYAAGLMGLDPDSYTLVVDNAPSRSPWPALVPRPWSRRPSYR